MNFVFTANSGLTFGAHKNKIWRSSLTFVSFGQAKENKKAVKRTLTY
jgi:hypothetical protein